MEGIHISLRWFSDIGIPLAFSRTPGGKREPSQFAKFSLRLLDKVTSTVSKKLTENKTIICCLLSRHFCHFYYSCVADETGYLASVFIVSLPGIHLSLQQQLYWLYRTLSSTWRFQYLNSQYNDKCSLCTDVPPPSEKIGRRDVCEIKSPSLIVFRFTFAEIIFCYCFLWQLKRCWQTNTTGDSFRARTQLFSRIFSTFIAKPGSN